VCTLSIYTLNVCTVECLYVNACIVSVVCLGCVLTVLHTCSNACLRGDDSPDKFKGHNPLCIPMEFGWTRYKYRVWIPVYVMSNVLVWLWIVFNCCCLTCCYCCRRDVDNCRQLTKHSSHRRAVFYLAPCRLRLRNDAEVDHYLLVTDSQLTIDLFCFDPDLRVDVEFMSKQVGTDTAASSTWLIDYCDPSIRDANATPSSLDSLKSRIVLLFWCHLTRLS